MKKVSLREPGYLPEAAQPISGRAGCQTLVTLLYNLFLFILSNAQDYEIWASSLLLVLGAFTDP